MASLREAARPFLRHNSKPGVPFGSGRMYAVVFDLDTSMLQQIYPNDSCRNAYADIRSFLAKRGFEWTQGKTYFGNDTVDAVSCVTAIQGLSKTFDWFEPCIRDIRMLRIEENNDLLPAIRDDEDKV